MTRIPAKKPIINIESISTLRMSSDGFMRKKFPREMTNNIAVTIIALFFMLFLFKTKQYHSN